MKRGRGAEIVPKDKYDLILEEEEEPEPEPRVVRLKDSNETNHGWSEADVLMAYEAMMVEELAPAQPAPAPQQTFSERAMAPQPPLLFPDLNHLLREAAHAAIDPPPEQRELPMDDFHEEESEEEEGEEVVAPQALPPLPKPTPDYLSNSTYAIGGEDAGGRIPIRPPLVHVDPSSQDFVFQHTETTYGICAERKIPELRVWGITESGNSVLLKIDYFKPYFFAQIPTEFEANTIKTKLNEYMLKKYRGRSDTGTFVLAMEPMEGRSICGWHRNAPMSVMYKITMAQPSHVAEARNCLEFVNKSVVDRPYKTYEANVPFELRWMIDSKINGCQWIRVKAGTYKHEDMQTRLISTSQYEFRAMDRAPGAIQAVPYTEKDSLAPMRYLSYDIEVLRKEKGFPTPKTDPAILIAAALNVTGVGIVHKVVFCYVKKGRGSFKAIEGTTVYVYHDEREMLLAFQQYVNATDPEALTGWNTSNFDMPYLAERAKQLGIFEEFMSFSRIKDKPTWLRSKTFQSKAYGAKVSTEMLCEGRFDYDGLVFMLRGQMEKYRSYKLNYISKQVLDDQKLDVDYSQIPTLYESDDDDDRTRLCFYCLKDALLPLQLLDKLMAVVNGIEQARVTGVPIKWLLARGQGVKTFSNLLRYKEPWEHTPSRSPKSNTQPTGGGDVREPIRNYYTVPLASLDFSSLYPSIMIAFNICFSTKESLAWARANLHPDDYWVPHPSIDKVDPIKVAREKALFEEEERLGIKRKKKSKKERTRDEYEEQFAGKEPEFCFVKRHVRQGVLPRLLEDLLAARANVKNMMKKVDQKKEPLYYSVLDGRQLALKVVCNSVYGFLKAFILTDKDLMAAVTSYGRNMIYDVAKIIETEFQDNDVVDVEACKKLGLDPETEPGVGEADPRPRCRTKAFIVYGDTDSVMVNFGDIILADVIRLGTAAAERATEMMQKPNKLVFEAVKLRSLYLNKKRYAALQIEKYIKGERMVDAIKRAAVVVKGLEGTRRDNAPIGSDTQNQVIEILLREGDVAKAEQYVISVIEDLMMDRVDMSKLVITKGLSKTTEQYEKGGTKQQHVELQKRMRKRSKFTGEAVPETGDRVPFVMIDDGDKNSKACARSEDPMYALKHGLTIDREYYLDKQIWPAVSRVFTGVYQPKYCVMVDSGMTQSEKEKLDVYHKFFAPHLPHMLSRKERRIKTGKAEATKGTIAAFAQVLPRCLECHVQLRFIERMNPCCTHCDEAAARKRLEEEMAKRAAAKEAAWDTCRKCQGGGWEKVTCSNVGCDNFFHRDQTIIELEDVCKDVKRFEGERVVVAKQVGVSMERAAAPPAAKKRAPAKKRATAAKAPKKRAHIAIE